MNLQEERRQIIAVNSGPPTWASQDWLVGECLQLLAKLEERNVQPQPNRRLGAEKALTDIAGFLWDIQWYQPMHNGQPSCPACTHFQEDGHAEHCNIAAIIKAHSNG